MGFRSWFARKPIRDGCSKFTSVRTGSRSFFEQLEPRLALTWAGTPPANISPPTSAVSVTLNSANSASGAASIATTEIDYYTFTARASGTYSLAATTPSSSLDTVLGVFAADGQRVAYNDDTAYPNTDSRVGVELTAGTRYYVGITNYTSSSRGSYSWAITGPATTTPTPPTTPTTSTTDDTYENNDTRTTAANLGTLTAARTINGLVLADASDWYRFTTNTAGTATSSVSISFQNPQGDLQLRLYNSAGTLLATASTGGNNESISLNGRAAGTYSVRVYGVDGAFSPNYTLTVNPPVAASPNPTPTPNPPPSASGFQITLNMTGLTASQQTIFQAAAARWSEVIVGDLPNATYRGQTVDDLLINASAISIDGVSGILGQAGPDAFRSSSSLPYHGIMQFDSADMASMERNGSLFSVVLHEMGHVLGVGTLWEDLGLLSGAGTSNPIFTGTQATAAYNQIYGTSARGVPVEATGGSGTRDSHWRESIFTNEVMTGWIGPGNSLPLSRITIGSLADMGYSVNFAAADDFSSSAVRSLTSSSVASSGGSASIRAEQIVDLQPNAAAASNVAQNSPQAASAALVRNRPTVALPASAVDIALAGEIESAANLERLSRFDRRLDDEAVSNLCQMAEDSLFDAIGTQLS